MCAGVLGSTMFGGQQGVLALIKGRESNCLNDDQLGDHIHTLPLHHISWPDLFACLSSSPATSCDTRGSPSIPSAVLHLVCTSFHCIL